jgi:hypothetical protein
LELETMSPATREFNMGGVADMRKLGLTLVATIALHTGIAAQTACPCATEKNEVSDSSLVELQRYRYAFQGVTKKEGRSLSKCTGLAGGQPVTLGQAFRETLCNCSPKRLCYKRLMIADGASSEPPTLFITYEER